MEDTQIFSLAKALGAKNLTNNSFSSNPLTQNYLTQRTRAQTAEEQLQATKTPLGALSSGIALYMQRKQENKALGELNEQMKAQEMQQEERRRALVASFPEAERVGADALDYETLAKIQGDRLKGLTPEDKLDLDNKRLQNIRLQRELSGDVPIKPMPATALKLQNEELETIGTTNNINQDLAKVQNQLRNKELKLGFTANIRSNVRNKLGDSSPASRNFDSFVRTLEKQRNDSLRLNKGVQTEGDSVRAWNELFDSINDPKLVDERLSEIQKINERAADLKKLNVDQIRANYNNPPIDYSQYQKGTAAIGDNRNDGNNDKKQALKNKYGLN